MDADDDLAGKRLYDAFMALKPAHLAETDWAKDAGVNRGFFSDLKKKASYPRRDTLLKLLRYIDKQESDLQPAPPAPKPGGRLPPATTQPSDTDGPDEVDHQRQRMIAERKARGWSTSKLAEVARAIAKREGSSLKLTQQSVSEFEQPDAAKRIPEWMRYVRMAFEEGEPEQDADTEPRDDLVYIRQLDIRYALGPGAAIERATSASLVPFNLGFVRSLTTTSTDKLFMASGHGDSMEPVLMKHDLVLIDTMDRSLDYGDTIYALEYAGSGLIKRLRAVMRAGQRKLMILSANPDYPPEEADPADVRIIGKVVWIARRM